ncbi:MAG: hypothetical protein OEX02_13085 [Cyclobacteriaceae bacterium]|nr:hypothetical protein [Cyclobacteriaceae bacterium]
MKLKETIIFSLAAGFLLIGIHQTMTYGFGASYWLYMLSIGLLLWYKMRKEAVKNSEKK